MSTLQIGSFRLHVSVICALPPALCSAYTTPPHYIQLLPSIHNPSPLQTAPPLYTQLLPEFNFHFGCPRWGKICDCSAGVGRMDLKGYLHRVGLSTQKPPSLTALRELHHRHLLSVPFGSLGIHSGERIILDHTLLYDKIVVRRQDGFCYENNGLFLWVLRESGYQPVVLSARVCNSITGVYGPPYDHMILAVELEGQRWLCDVGFGEGIAFPIPLEAGWEGEHPSGVFRLQKAEEEWYLERKEDGGWRSLYKFRLEEKRFEDFRDMCDYHQMSPSSIFFCKSFCSLLLPRGRATYMGCRLISTEYTAGGGTVKSTTELTEGEIPRVLRETFGIVLNGKLVPKDEPIVPPECD
ncbi:hypothetical protein XENTR_v10017378 [Xenopus tropicalis]|nr:hypothetical protein XENTR_v10017378 [Xenopus tropicalis]